VFGGITDRLIPLFAIGAFLAFTMSQAGMAAHWWHALRRRDGAYQSSFGSRAGVHAVRAKLAINGVGAVATGIALAIILSAKFVEGAWLTVIVIPCTVLLLRSIHRYYDRVDNHLLLEGSFRRIDVRDRVPPVVIVPIERWDRLSRKAIHYAIRLSDDVTALHVGALGGPESEDQETRLRAEWDHCVAGPARAAGLRPPRLELVSSFPRRIAAFWRRCCAPLNAPSIVVPLSRPAGIGGPARARRGTLVGHAAAHPSRAQTARAFATLWGSRCDRYLRAMADRG
jgi:hypothetical protein